MSAKSNIEWTDASWNPVTGCTKVSPGCSRCYAETFAERFRGVAGHPYEEGFDLTLRPERLSLPLSWSKPRRVFVNSMSDLFHEDIPDDFIHRVFQTMVEARQHTFQILTKRSERLSEFAPRLPWPSNIWIGVSVENQWWTRRVNDLITVPAAVRFLSCEPLLGMLNLSLEGIDWVIVGGESGGHARPMNTRWVTAIRDQCKVAQVPFFFKQWGGSNKKIAGRLLNGRTWDAMPAAREALVTAG